jgi:Fe-S cluster assembly protein SufD
VPDGIVPVVASAADPGSGVVLVAGTAPPRILTPLPPGVEVEEPGRQPWPLGEIAGEVDAFSWLNLAHAVNPVRIRVSRRAPADATVVVVNWLDADGAAVFPRLLVDVEGGASASLVEVTASSDVASLVVPVIELAVGAGAHLRYTNVQLLGPRGWQVAHQASRVQADATLTSASVALGGDYARVRTDSSLVGRGATGRLLAVWFAAGGQMPDLRTVQDHRAPHTTSDLVFKGAVAGHAHSVYTGVIRVAKGAKGTNAMQTNRNLVLQEGAEADSVPNLEIEDNDVRCSHASAVGPIDEDQLFYLESRGVPTETAARLIALGFLDEVVAQVPNRGLVEWLRLEIASRLNAAWAPASSGVGG